MEQKIIVTALPNGLSGTDSSATKIISAFISLQVKDTSLTTLQNVKDMYNWPDLINGATFSMMVNDVEVAAKVKYPSKGKQLPNGLGGDNYNTQIADAGLWKNLFSPGVNVRQFEPEAAHFSTLQVRSYPVKHIVDYVEDAIRTLGVQYSNTMPDSTYYTTNKKFTDISMYKPSRFIPKSETMIGRFPAPSHDTFVEENNDPIETVLDNLKTKSVIPFSEDANAATDFAQLRLFHGLHNKSDVTLKTQVAPDFEFHDILSVLASYPQLMRRLGLVIDLEISPAATAGIALWPANGTVRVIPKNLSFTTATEIVCPLTAYDFSGKGFYAQAADTGFINKGHVQINSDAFTVFQLDADGAALKLGQQMDALLLREANQNFRAYEGSLTSVAQFPFYFNELPKKEGLPSLRTSGIAIARNGMAEKLSGSFKTNADLESKLANTVDALSVKLSTPLNIYMLSSEVLHAEDVNLGYRADVFDNSKAAWYSLHFRNNKYSFSPPGSSVKTVINDLEADEGFIQISAAQDIAPDGEKDDDQPLKAAEVIARWDGWSLSVPKPGLALNDPILNKNQLDEGADENGNPIEVQKYRKPATVQFNLQVLPGLVTGTLPKLRFGNAYKLKLRTVDLAGNSVAYNQEPETNTTAVTPDIIYKRYEPAGTPFLEMGNPVKDGESSEQIVVRSNDGMTCGQYEAANPNPKADGTIFTGEAIRYVKPPRTNVQMAEYHKLLDAGFGKGNEVIAKAIYSRLSSSDKDPFLDDEKASPDLKVMTDSTVSIDYITDAMAAGVTFCLSDQDLNPKLPNPDLVTKRISFYPSLLANPQNGEVTEDKNYFTKPLDFDTWMEPKPCKVKLTGDVQPSIEVDSSRTLNIKLMPGTILKLNYSSFWRVEDINSNSAIGEILKTGELTADVVKKIMHGQHWMFSPYREITFVHAVQQPVEPPVIEGVLPVRNYGETTAGIGIKIKVHSHSTDKLDIESKWTEWVDDVDKSAPQQVVMQSKVYDFSALYFVPDYQFGDVDIKNNPFKAIPQQFGDTKHRMIDYKVIASTRYREYFTELINQHAKNNTPFSITKESNEILQVNIPASARPLAPDVAYVIPSFIWNHEQNIPVGGFQQPGAAKHSNMRQSALRVYLQRPWYSSGDGEQLAVVLFEYLPSYDMTRFATTWGTDPTKLSNPTLTNIYPHSDIFSLGAVVQGISQIDQDKLTVTAVAYDVHYDDSRQLYYADIKLTADSFYTPFIRLALARYQKNALITYAQSASDTTAQDCRLSPVVLTDYIQLPSSRQSTLQFKDNMNITVGITGLIHAQKSANQIDIIIDNADVPVAGEAYITVSTDAEEKHLIQRSYNIGGDGINSSNFSISDNFTLPGTSPYIVRIFEYELLLADPLRHTHTVMSGPDHAPVSVTETRKRLVYADAFKIN